MSRVRSQKPETYVDPECPGNKHNGRERGAAISELTLANNRALIQRLMLLVPPSGNSQRRHQSAGIQGEELGRFMIRIDFDVLMGDIFLDEDNPSALDEWAEPAAVELQRVVYAVGCGKGSRGTCGFGGEGGVHVRHGVLTYRGP